MDEKDLAIAQDYTKMLRKLYAKSDNVLEMCVISEHIDKAVLIEGALKSRLPR
jgi:hypothetical protein